ncbi:MAG: alpha/beta-type small acid-soluble spore protein [Peptococcaceae bacterium]|nr:alpha/beta-type small acid-soluble spore protein [Peptococcaceae bacterium]
MSKSNSNKLVVQGSRQALEQLKYETANELGIPNYGSADKGNLTSRENGYVGGYMTKKLVSYAEQALANGSSSSKR